MRNWHTIQELKIYWNQYYLQTNENNEENGSHHYPVEDCSTHLQHDMQRNVS